MRACVAATILRVLELTAQGCPPLLPVLVMPTSASVLLSPFSLWPVDFWSGTGRASPWWSRVCQKGSRGPAPICSQGHLWFVLRLRAPTAPSLPGVSRKMKQPREVQAHGSQASCPASR